MDSKELLKVVVEAADSKRAEDIVALDVQGISLLADYFVIMQANSERQVKAIADIIEEKVEEAGFEVRNVEGKDEQTGYCLIWETLSFMFSKLRRDSFTILKSFGLTHLWQILTIGSRNNDLHDICQIVR